MKRIKWSAVLLQSEITKSWSDKAIKCLNFPQTRSRTADKSQIMVLFVLNYSKAQSKR